MSGGRQLGKKFFRKVTNHRWGGKLCVTKKKLFIPQHSKKIKKISPATASSYHCLAAWLTRNVLPHTGDQARSVE